MPVSWFLAGHGTLKQMDPVTALRQIAYYKDRSAGRLPSRVMAYRNAADIVEGLDEDGSASGTARPTAGSRYRASGRRPPRLSRRRGPAVSPTR